MKLFVQRSLVSVIINPNATFLSWKKKFFVMGSFKHTNKQRERSEPSCAQHPASTANNSWPISLEVSPCTPPRNYAEGNNQVFILISRSTTSNTAFYSSLDLEVTVLFHSSWLLSDLYFGNFLVAFTSSTIPWFPWGLGPAVHSNPAQQAQPSQAALATHFRGSPWPHPAI